MLQCCLGEGMRSQRLECIRSGQMSDTPNSRPESSMLRSRRGSDFSTKMPRSRAALSSEGEHDQARLRHACPMGERLGR